eukprot:snap_masked-scaffold_27-processed-gene-1.38-mRNA-1 protein AED:1.00 eAED:1.00 QI:0/-1/0/0/-1/1/1/0/72
MKRPRRREGFEVTESLDKNVGSDVVAVIPATKKNIITFTMEDSITSFESSRRSVAFSSVIFLVSSSYKSEPI